MVEGGLRAEEASNLSVNALMEALRTEGLLPVIKAAARGGIVDDMSDDLEDQQGLLSALDRLEAGHRKNVYVEVRGKGGRVRQVPFSIGLVRDLLTIGLWSVRRDQIGEWTRSTTFSPPGEVFLSFKTRSKLKPGSVSDLMKDAFTHVGVEGSGHRLRAHYATMTAASIWDECFAMNGYRFDQTVMNMALDRLAEALGHSSVTTTVRHYIDMALLKHLGAGNRQMTDRFAGVWNIMIANRGDLIESKVELIRRVIDGIAQDQHGTGLELVISMAVDDPDLNPLKPRNSDGNVPQGLKLKLV